MDIKTHLPLDKMAANLGDDILKCILLTENERIPIQISLKFVPRIPIDNTPPLVQVMAWHRTGDKPLPEPIMTQFIDAYMRQYREMRESVEYASSDMLLNHKILSRFTQRSRYETTYHGHLIMLIQMADKCYYN